MDAKVLASVREGNWCVHDSCFMSENCIFSEYQQQTNVSSLGFPNVFENKAEGQAKRLERNSESDQRKGRSSSSRLVLPPYSLQVLLTAVLMF
jgi:hypothetical protein